MEDKFVQNQYDMDVKKNQAEQYAAFVLSRVLKVFFYLCKLVLSIFFGVLKNVARTIGLPVR